MRGWVAAAAAASLTFLGACGGDGDGGAASGDGGADGGASDVTGTTLDQSPFCVAIRALEGLGADSAGGEQTQAAVLEQNKELAQLVQDATYNAPAEAPGDVGEMLDDYRTFSAAVTRAAGDVDAALADLEGSSPGFMAGLNDHREAFVFFAERCGTAPPP